MSPRRSWGLGRVFGHGCTPVISDVLRESQKAPSNFLKRPPYTYPETTNKRNESPIICKRFSAVRGLIPCLELGMRSIVIDAPQAAQTTPHFTGKNTLRVKTKKSNYIQGRRPADVPNYSHRHNKTHSNPCIQTRPNIFAAEKYCCSARYAVHPPL